MYHFEKMNSVAETNHAVAANGGKRVHIPNDLTPATLVDTARRLGLMIPTALTAAAATGNLRASGHKFNLKEVDFALSNAKVVDMTERLMFKRALERFGVL